jgi:hypothetical protein
MSEVSKSEILKSDFKKIPTKIYIVAILFCIILIIVVSSMTWYFTKETCPTIDNKVDILDTIDSKTNLDVVQTNAVTSMSEQTSIISDQKKTYKTGIVRADQTDQSWYQGCYPMSEINGTKIMTGAAKLDECIQKAPTGTKYIGYCESCGGECWAGGPDAHLDTSGAVYICDPDDNPQNNIHVWSLGDNNASIDPTDPILEQIPKASDVLPVRVYLGDQLNNDFTSLVRLGQPLYLGSSYPNSNYIKIDLEWDQVVVISEIHINVENIKNFTLLRDGKIAVQYWAAQSGSDTLQKFTLKDKVITNRATLIVNSFNSPFNFRQLTFL